MASRSRRRPAITITGSLSPVTAGKDVRVNLSLAKFFSGTTNARHAIINKTHWCEKGPRGIYDTGAATIDQIWHFRVNWLHAGRVINKSKNLRGVRYSSTGHLGWSLHCTAAPQYYQLSWWLESPWHPSVGRLPFKVFYFPFPHNIQSVLSELTGHPMRATCV